jgi:PAS domain S-box-containing protein
MQFQAELLAAVGHPMIAVDASRTITYWNRAAEVTYGWTAQEAVGRNSLDLIKRVETPEQTKAMIDTLVRGELWSDEVEVTAKSGAQLSVQVTYTPVFDDLGRLSAVIAVSVDASEHQRQARFQAHLLDVAGQAFVATDPRGAITYWNRAAEELYGWSADEVLGRPVTEVTPSDASREQAEEILSALVSGTKWSGEFMVQRRDGSAFPAFVTDTPIMDDGGGVAGVIGVSMDVTERRALEDRVRQGQRLESLGQLAGGIAHDFNNLLNVMLNYAKFIASATDGEAREDAQEVINAGEAAARLTRQLLTFARREPVELQALDLNAVVEDIHGLLARSIGEDIHLVVRAAAVPVITADRGQVEQILLNLAVNARDAMPGGGTLTIESSTVELDEEYVQLHPDATPGRYVQLAVSDTGTGMSGDVAARAFEPFFTTKAAHSGTGLGLATVHGIVSGAGGSISLYSEDGLGTTMRVYFPVAAGAVVTPRGGHRREPRPGCGQSVLVVEDHDAVRALTVRMLRRNGYEVTEARDPLDALGRAAERQFDLVLTDVVMPEMSGRAVADHIRSANPSQAVLFMSGYSDGVLGPSGVLDLGVALVQKPFTEAALLDAVSEALT